AGCCRRCGRCSPSATTCSRRRAATWCSGACSMPSVRRGAVPTPCSPCSDGGSTASPAPCRCCGSATTSPGTTGGPRASASPAAGGEFVDLEERLGLVLPPSRVRAREIHASPFDFPAQCLFGIPTDLPEPRDDEPGHDAAVARVLVELAQASDGGMFVLFTSHGALRRAAEAVRDPLGGRWPLLVQGDGQRDQLLRRFREA